MEASNISSTLPYYGAQCLHPRDGSSFDCLTLQSMFLLHLQEDLIYGTAMFAGAEAKARHLTWRDYWARGLGPHYWDMSHCSTTTIWLIKFPLDYLEYLHFNFWIPALQPTTLLLPAHAHLLWRTPGTGGAAAYRWSLSSFCILTLKSTVD